MSASPLPAPVTPEVDNEPVLPWRPGLIRYERGVTRFIHWSRSPSECRVDLIPHLETTTVVVEVHRGEKKFSSEVKQGEYFLEIAQAMLRIIAAYPIGISEESPWEKIRWRIEGLAFGGFLISAWNKDERVAIPVFFRSIRSEWEVELRLLMGGAGRHLRLRGRCETTLLHQALQSIIGAVTPT